MMTTGRRMARAARASFREWWPELLCAALLAAIAFAGQPDDFLFSVFCAIVGAIFWGMGYRHRALPLHKRIDGLTAGVRDLMRDVREDRVRDTEQRDVRPQLRLVRRDQGGSR